MHTVVPSDVVRFVEAWQGVERLRDSNAHMEAHAGDAATCKGVAELVRAVPAELLLLDAVDRARLSLALAATDVHVDRSISSGNSTLGSLPGSRGHPFRIIWECMQRCPDEAAVESARRLPFILERELRDSIELDISAALRALSSNSFKAATVMAGAAAEALLLWILQQPKAFASVKGMKPKGVKLPALTPDDLVLQPWGLDYYVDAADAASILSKSTCSAAKLAKDYRNLIHPGAAQRLQASCDIGTAHSAVGALFRVIVDVERYAALP